MKSRFKDKPKSRQLAFASRPYANCAGAGLADRGDRDALKGQNRGTPVARKEMQPCQRTVDRRVYSR